MDARAADDRAVELFRRRHGRDPEVLVRSPGRVNIIGEHTDYNDGFVLPAAIDRGVWIAASATHEPVVDLVSEGFEPVLLPLHGGDRPEGWGIHPVGIAAVLREAGRDLRGWHGAIASDLPPGAGLSSSAALDLALARAFHAVSGFDWDPVTMARVGQRVENDWLGVASGIMDQVACASGRAGHALLLDCRSLDITPVALPSDIALGVLDTATRRELTTSEYNDRRKQCEEAAAALGVDSLRDVTTDDLDARGSTLAPVQLRRARHVVTENERTLHMVQALGDGDLQRAGALLDAGHRSLRDDFEVSSDALDVLTDAARASVGCRGVRLTGGGFAGCAVALVDRDAADDFVIEVTQRYERRTGRSGPAYICHATDGTSHTRFGDGS
ncbi:MAG TPA: galactokinase [Euzebyales bacterium]